jgi:TetR/AcrR family transcriptional regulator, lmrAB and yxaGH operons repressor
MANTKWEAGGTRQRILEASEDLFGRQGYSGTGLKAILAASEAPYGSLYHFFPGGKEELGVAALQASGQVYLHMVEAIFGDGIDAVDATESFFEGAAAVVEMSGFEDACPIATVALEVASVSEALREAAAEAFESWLTALQERFVDAGMTPLRAREVAVELFCAIEGAFLLSRTTRSVEPILIAGRACAAVVAAASTGG